MSKKSKFFSFGQPSSVLYVSDSLSVDSYYPITIMFLLTADVLHWHIPVLLNSSNTSEQVPFLHFAVRVASTARQPSPRDPHVHPHSHYTNCQVIQKQYAPNSKQIHEFVWDTFHNFHLSSPFVKKSWWQQCSSPDVALSLSLQPRCMSFSSQLVPIHLEIQPITRLEHLTITPSTNTYTCERYVMSIATDLLTTVHWPQSHLFNLLACICIKRVKSVDYSYLGYDAMLTGN